MREKMTDEPRIGGGYYDPRTIIIMILIIVIINAMMILLINSFFSIQSLDYIINADDFINKCNNLHGDGGWKIHKISEYITYSHEFWQKYPIVKTDYWDLDSPMYTCMEN